MDWRSNRYWVKLPYRKNISKKYGDVKEERVKILAEREKIQKQLADLDKLEVKVKDW